MDKKSKSEKRADLQGIRGIAIISVLAFHFFPKWCPNGFLGVDQFFVLSGFLMCMLLRKADQQNPFSLVTLFYSKRLKRILPLYLFVILMSLIALYLVFPETALKTNQKSASQALIFMSNRAITAEENYFQMLSIALDIFTHTWSLSVEVQFYLLIPFIYLFGRNLSGNFQYFYYTLIGCISFAFSVFSSPTIAFNSVFARIWQFLIGFLIYDLCQSFKNEKETSFDYEKLLESEENAEIDGENREKVHQNHRDFYSIPLTFGLILITFLPFSLDSGIVRLIVTLATGFLILFSNNDHKFLSNRVLTYFGDVSYALYLVHWPIYAYWKLTQNNDQFALFISLIASIILSIIIHETYEKWYLQQCSTSIGMLTIILFISNVIFINKDQILDRFEKKEFGSLDGVLKNMTMVDAAQFNHKWNVNDYDNLYTPTCNYETEGTIFGWCNHTGLTGKHKIMTIGNSWNPNHATVFYQECGHLAKSIRQGSVSGCEVLYPSHPTPGVCTCQKCNEEFKDFEKHVKMEKPDYLFVFTRFLSIGDPFPKNVSSFDEDPIYQVMKKQMLKFTSNISKKLYILDAMPRVNKKYIEQIVPMLSKGTPMKELDNLLVDTRLLEMARRRYSQLVKDCDGKCILVDYNSEFWNSATQTYRFYDEKGFSYFTSVSHLSPHGIEHIRHVWRDICRKI